MRSSARPLPIAAFILLAMLGSACSAQSTQSEVPRTATLPGVEDAPFPYAQPAELGLSQEKLSKLTETVAEWVRDGQIIGAEVLLVKGRKIVLHETFGWSDKAAGAPLQRNTIYRIRSMTKPFTGTSVLLLSEEGKLSLDDKASEYLSSWRNERSGEITIRQLLTHSGGFIQGGFPAPFMQYRNLREAVDAVGGAGPQNQPGVRYEYSDVGSATLGAIVAEISGMPVERFIETRILEPLRLLDTHTAFSTDAPWAERMNPTYRAGSLGNRWVQYWHPSREQQFPFFRASGGIYTTVFDYSRWLHLWMDGGVAGDFQLLPEVTVVAALTPGMSAGYGLHWQIISTAPEGEPLPTFGHGGSDGTLAVALPELNATALIFTQTRGNGVLREFMPLAREALQGEGGS